MTEPDYAHLIATGQCSARCLRAHTQRCRHCPCAGLHHGKLADRDDRCIRGHDLTIATNVHVTPDGQRYCRQCNRDHGRDSMRRFAARRRAAK